MLLQIYLAWLIGENQENLTGVLWWCLWPYMLNYLYIHMCTRSTDTYCISPYPKPVRARVSHR